MMTWNRMLRHRVSQLGWSCATRTYRLDDGSGAFRMYLVWPRFDREWPGKFRYRDVAVHVDVPNGGDRVAAMYALFMKAAVDAKDMLFDVRNGDFIDCLRDEVFGTPLPERRPDLAE
jgi:hypothetical protein